MEATLNTLGDMMGKEAIGVIAQITGSDKSLIIRSSGERVIARVGDEIYAKDIVISPNNSSIIFEDSNTQYRSDLHNDLIHLSHSDLGNSHTPVDESISFTEDTSLAVNVLDGESSAGLHTATLPLSESIQAYSQTINNGTIAVNDDGSIAYTPTQNGDTSTVTLYYNVHDFVVVDDKIASLGVDGSVNVISNDLASIIDELTGSAGSHELLFNPMLASVNQSTYTEDT